MFRTHVASRVRFADADAGRADIVRVSHGLQDLYGKAALPDEVLEIYNCGFPQYVGNTDGNIWHAPAPGETVHDVGSSLFICVVQNGLAPRKLTY